MITVQTHKLSAFNGLLLEKHNFAENAEMDILKEHHFYYDWKGKNVQDIQQFIAKFAGELNGHSYSQNYRDTNEHIAIVLTVDGVDNDELYLTAYPHYGESDGIKLSRDYLGEVSEITLTREESKLFELFESAVQAEAINDEHIMRVTDDEGLIHNDRDVIVIDFISSSMKVSDDGSMNMPFALFVCNLYDLKVKYTGFNYINVSKYINDKFGYINKF